MPSSLTHNLSYFPEHLIKIYYDISFVVLTLITLHKVYHINKYFPSLSVFFCAANRINVLISQEKIASFHISLCYRFGLFYVIIRGIFSERIKLNKW